MRERRGPGLAECEVVMGYVMSEIRVQHSSIPSVFYCNIETEQQ